jgi:hypothetical protein
MRPKNSGGLIALLLATALVVLIAWVQLAGLAIADLLVRLRDFGVRLSLGATRRQLLVSSALWHGAAAACVGESHPRCSTRCHPADVLPAGRTPRAVRVDRLAICGVSACTRRRRVWCSGLLATVGAAVASSGSSKGRVESVALTASRGRRVLLVTQVAGTPRDFSATVCRMRCATTTGLRQRRRHLRATSSRNCPARF